MQLAAAETKKLGLPRLLRRKTATDFGPKSQEVSLRWKRPSSRCVSSLSLIFVLWTNQLWSAPSPHGHSGSLTERICTFHHHAPHACTWLMKAQPREAQVGRGELSLIGKRSTCAKEAPKQAEHRALGGVTVTEAARNLTRQPPRTSLCRTPHPHPPRIVIGTESTGNYDIIAIRSSRIVQQNWDFSVIFLGSDSSRTLPTDSLRTELHMRPWIHRQWLKPGFCFITSNVWTAF